MVQVNQEYFIWEITLGNNITISNLKIINGYSHNSGGSISGLEYNLINVTFENNFAVYGGGALTGSFLNIANCTFINNTAEEGGAVSAAVVKMENCTFDRNYAPMGAALKLYLPSSIKNTVFKNSHNITRSLILGEMYSILELENCVFLNSTSKYATAVFLEMPLVAKNCIFKDLHSTQSAGAIGLKSPFEVVIENCTFINTTAGKNGGAMFLDMIGGYGFMPGNVSITNTTFINAYGNYGGAVVLLGGDLNMENTSFISNRAYMVLQHYLPL